MVAEYISGVVWIVGAGVMGGAEIDFVGVFLGRGCVFGWRVVWIYRKIFFAVVRPLKRLFDSAKIRSPQAVFPPGRKTKGAVIFPPPDNISDCLITLFQSRFATFVLLQNGF